MTHTHIDIRILAAVLCLLVAAPAAAQKAHHHHHHHHHATAKQGAPAAAPGGTSSATGAAQEGTAPSSGAAAADTSGGAQGTAPSSGAAPEGTPAADTSAGGDASATGDVQASADMAAGPDATTMDADASAASDADSGAGKTDFSDRWVSLGLKVGGYLPDIVNKLGPHVDVGVEAAVLLPFLERRLGIYVEAAFAPPGHSESGIMDPRLGTMGSTWSFDTSTSQLFFSLGPVFRFLPPGSFIVPYIGAFGRVYLLRTQTKGTGNDQPFGQNTEQSTEYGGGGLLGAEMRLGPGSLLLEASFGISHYPHVITGKTSTGALAVQLGYRLFL